MTPKVYSHRSSHSPEPKGRDNCQSPPYAILPLLLYLPKDKIIWEPAVGEGNMADALNGEGYMVNPTGNSKDEDFFFYKPDDDEWDIIVTNPPWSRTIEWTQRCFELGKPFALLLKADAHANTGMQKLCAKYGDFEFVYPECRCDFSMPLKGWDSKGAQFNTIWYTHGLNIGRPFTYLAPMREAKKQFKQQLKLNTQQSLF